MPTASEKVAVAREGGGGPGAREALPTNKKKRKKEKISVSSYNSDFLGTF